MKRLSILITSLMLAGMGMAQKIDTIKIDGTKLNTNALIPGEHQWLVYFKNGKDSSRVRYTMLNRRIAFIDYQGKAAIAVTQRWEGNDTVVHTAYTVCDRKTFAPMYHEVWWRRRGNGKFDFLNKEAQVNGKPVTTTGPNEAGIKMRTAFDQSFKEYSLIWHLDLETFPQLPYRANTAFVINFYDPPASPAKKQVYTVIGSGTLSGYNDQKIECWLLAHGSRPANYEVFWISKKTKEVLKLEQEFGGKYRYKVKLPFSN